MFLQKQEKREVEAALGESARAAMTRRATIRKQLRCRFALIEILGVCSGAHDQKNGTEDGHPAPQLRLRYDRL